MKIRWCEEKNRVLKHQRGMTFRELLKHPVIGIVDHPGRPSQRKMLFDCEGYVWAVPFVIREGEVFLKTLYPCRKYTRLYKGD